MVNTAMKNVTTTASNTLSKMSEIPVKTKPNHAAAVVTSRPVLADPRSPPHPHPHPPPPPPPSLHTKPKHTTAHTESTRPPALAPTKSLDKENTSQIKKPESGGQVSKPKESTTKANNISSSVFLDQFEKTAHEFAAQHNIAMEQIWESLLVHALPKDKLAWAEKTILDKNLDWKTARGRYLSAYPDAVPSKKAAASVQEKKEFGMPALVKTSALADSTQPSSVPTTTNASNAQTRERQSRYAEYLLSIEMKEYDSITDFNAKFYRYASIACMNLSDVSLSRRYISSLLPKYRLPVERVIQQNLPQHLKDTMLLASGMIIPLEKARKSNGEACWNHPPLMKRNNLQEDTRSQKRFCA
ncbi:hypothetical protein HPULCUR_006509 [Helicostylum pulchrum]|uniref:Uncharacterized protein n=1 Tax=Helicostylum pulchrum TaxID=562976 RepID=A0ABP9Y445_9FUNG